MFRTEYAHHSALSALALALALGGAVSAQAAPHHAVKHHAAKHRYAAPSGIKARVAQLPVGVERPTREVHVSIGQGEIINLPSSAASVWVSNPTAADVYINNPHQIHLFGKAFGETTLFATGANGEVIYSANILVNQNLTSLDRMMKLAMPDANIHVEVLGQVAVMTGTVASQNDVVQAESLVLGLLNPGKKPGDALNITPINRLKTSMSLQVNLQVRIAEVSRSLMRVIGTNIATRQQSSSGGFQYGLSRGASPGTITGNGSLSNLPLADPSMKYGFAPNTLPNQPFDPSTGQFIKPGTIYNAITNPSNINRLNLAGHFLGLDILTALDLGERRRRENDDLAAVRVAEAVDQPVREHPVGEACLAAGAGPRAVQRRLHRRRRDPVRVDDVPLDQEHDHDRADDRDHPVEDDADAVREVGEEAAERIPHRKCSCRHASIFAWSPERSTSGTVQPRNSDGRV